MAKCALFIANVAYPARNIRLCAALRGILLALRLVTALGALCGVLLALRLIAALGALFTPLSALSFLVFTLLYTPCIAAVATIKRELSSRLQTVAVVFSQCAIAWVVAFIAYSIARLAL